MQIKWTLFKGNIAKRTYTTRKAAISTAAANGEGWIVGRVLPNGRITDMWDCMGNKWPSAKLVFISHGGDYGEWRSNNS